MFNSLATKFFQIKTTNFRNKEGDIWTHNVTEAAEDASVELLLWRLKGSDIILKLWE